MGEKTLGQINCEGYGALWERQHALYRKDWETGAKAVRAHVLEEAAKVADETAEDQELVATIKRGDERELATARAEQARSIANAIRALAKDGAE